MSENDPGDDRETSRNQQGQIGLSIPPDETQRRPSSARSRRRPGAYEKLQQAVQVDQSVVSRWFLPFAILFLVLLVTGIAIFLGQGSRLDKLERRVAALNEQAVNADTVELDRMQQRIDALGKRARDMEELTTEVQTLQKAIATQQKKIETLTSRLAKLEQAPAESGDGASGSKTTEGSGAAAGGWTINLITVADRASAEEFQKRLEKIGVDSNIRSVTVNNRTLLRVVVPGFESRDAAERTGADLKKQLELSDNPWITRQ